MLPNKRYPTSSKLMHQMYRKYVPNIMDDSLSLYEQMIAVIEHINNLVRTSDSLSDELTKDMNELITEVNNIRDFSLPENLINVLTEWHDSGFLNKVINDVVVTRVNVVENTSYRLETEKADKEYVDNQIAMMQSGVKGIYATLTLLTEDKPTGDSGNYVVESDGYIYTWKGGSWQSTGIKYLATQIAEKSQGFEIFKDRFITQPNLFDPTKDGYMEDVGFSGTTGTTVNSPGRFISNFIPVPEGQELLGTIDGYNIFLDPNIPGHTSNKVAVYDSAKTWIKTISAKDMYDYVAEVDSYVRLAYMQSNNINIHTDKQDYFLRESAIIKDGISENGSNVVDVAIMMGQSNMAGRGVKRAGLEQTKDAFPIVPEGWGYEFKAISEPLGLHAIEEPFGYRENSDVTGAINDSASKTGSMVSAFVNGYYPVTKTPLVCVSASQGATSVDEWLPNTPKLNDAIQRLKDTLNWLRSANYTIGNVFMVWCQGEADYQMDVTEYKNKTISLVEEMQKNGVTKCMLVRIGEHNSGEGTNYDSIIQAQTDLCREHEHFVLVGTKFAEMRLQGLMKDTSHYYQEGYNIQGSQAGVNVANYIKLLKEPLIYDSKYGELYYSHKV